MRKIQNPKTKILFLIGNLVMIFFTIALLPLNLFVCNFPAWVVVLSGGIAVSGSLIWLFLFHTRMATKILLPTTCVLLVVISSLVAYTIPYWNSFNFKSYRPQAMGFRDTLTYSQTERDLDEVISLLERTHPMFRDGLTAEIQARYEEAKEHLRADPQITANDLRREIQWMLNPMHDAHTSTYNNYPDDRYLKDTPQKFSEGYSVFSVNGLTREDLREIAKTYESYETEEWIGVDVGSLASLEFYGITAPFTFIWENGDGERVTEVYAEDDFVLLDEYLAIRDSYAETPTEENPFVFYEIDEERSLAVLTLTSCQTGAYYNDCVRQMFTEVKEKNIRNVAVDLRSNGGGNSGVANEFIRYLPVDVYGDAPSDWRWNFLTFRFAGTIKNDRYTDLTFDGKVYILTDHNSFSSAMLFPQMMQDNDLGKVIGESPANNVNSYGDIACFYLKESGLYIQISTKKWYRIDSENPDDYVVPDFPCDGKDVFETLYEVIGQ